MSDEIEFHRAEEWTAVYLNGKLQRVGDHYLADEWLQAHFGVKLVEDDAFMRGQTGRDGVARDLDQVHAYRQQRDETLALAAELRRQAEVLVEQARQLEQS